MMMMMTKGVIHLTQKNLKAESWARAELLHVYERARYNDFFIY